MVARIVSGRSIKGAINYNERKIEQGKAIFLSAENYLKDGHKLNPAEKIFVLKHRGSLNERVKTNCVHISLNFETHEKISAEKMQEIARVYMEGIGFGKQPYLIYRHQDAAHPHCHIVTTNIDADGNRISLHNLGRDFSEKAIQKNGDFLKTIVEPPKSNQQRFLWINAKTCGGMEKQIALHFTIFTLYDFPCRLFT